MAQDLSGIGVLVLAAGRSTRMGGPNKLLADLDGFPVVRHALQAAAASGLDPIVVVTGHEAEAVRAVLAPLEVTFVDNPAYADGLSTSLKAGIAALPDSVDAVLVTLGDMPLVTSTLLRRLAAAFSAEPGGIAAVPVHDGAWGNPVIIARALFPRVQALQGDAGARKLLEHVRDRVIEVPVSEDAVALDVDTPEALAEIRARPPG
jgi:molybdenum cofactor cytidylyltransferase